MLCLLSPGAPLVSLTQVQVRLILKQFCQSLNLPYKQITSKYLPSWISKIWSLFFYILTTSCWLNSNNRLLSWQFHHSRLCTSSFCLSTPIPSFLISMFHLMSMSFILCWSTSLSNWPEKTGRLHSLLVVWGLCRVLYDMCCVDQGLFCPVVFLVCSCLSQQFFNAGSLA